MGIPKFYRWISERYPCLSEKIREYQIPDFDNLYLDMNGIIHSCSHPNDDDVHLRISEEVIFREIFRYIDYLFRMIKPKSIFFMAIDGVAPRAKMNQQRGRRFRSAKLALDQEAEAVKKGEKLPDQERFDSICITPGTEFMAKLHEQLKYFVKVKVSTDPLWQRQGLCIYLSGHDVPGEGEHKIMDFIRHIRSQPDYNANTRHCLYGLDADLIMLGLSTHELHFSLLREEVKFGTQKKRRSKKEYNSQPLKNDEAKFDLSTVSVFKAPDTTTENSLVSNNNQSTPAVVDATILPVQMALMQIFPEATHTYSGAVKVGEIKTNKKTTDTVPCTSSSKVLELSTLEKDLMPPPTEKELRKDTYHPPLPEKTNFLLLHLSLLRDYIDAEFQELKIALKDHPHIKYDLECIIDDWILMSILVGNDFVPNLPHLHINNGALPMLYNTYARVLPRLDGYLNENGILRLNRFEVFLKELSDFDVENFRQTYDDMKYMASKTGKNIVLGEKMFDAFEFDEADGFDEEKELEGQVNSELQDLINRTNEEVEMKVEGSNNDELSEEIFNDFDGLFIEEDTPEFRLEFAQYKRHYYKTKIEPTRPVKDEVKAMVVEYVQAIQWVLLYYYKGVSSWCWYYPYHYSPFASDVRNFKDYEIIFDKGQPFKPFEQLLAVLPSYSKKLLPACYQWLMIHEESPIKDYYPEAFNQDLNGKKQDWEAVVVIPFIDEQKLIKAMEMEAMKLSTEENFRNSRGKMLVHTYTKNDTGPVESPGNIFPPLSTTHVNIESIVEVDYDPLILPKGVHPKAQRDKIYQGFPTIKSIKHECSLENAKVKVFDFLARDVSMVLDLSMLDEEEEKMDCETVAQNLLGKTVWVNWPHLTHVLVTGVSDINNSKYILTEQGVKKDPTYNKQDVVTKGLIERHMKYKGIKLGLVKLVLWAKMMEGRKVRCDRSGRVQIENLWGKIEQPFAHKTTIKQESDVAQFSMVDCEGGSYQDFFQKGDTVFLLETKLYGAMATVRGHDKGKVKVVVEYSIPVYRRIDEESYDDIHEKLIDWGDKNYFSSGDAARACNMPISVLAKITGSIFVEVEKGQGQSSPKKKRGDSKKKNANKEKSDSQESLSSPEEIQLAQETKRVNVGLDLKFNKRNLKVRGYTAKDDNGKWIYSLKTVKLVQEYAKEFPDFISFLRSACQDRDMNEYQASAICPKDPKGKIRQIEAWLDSHGLRDAQRIDIAANIMDEDEIQLVWKHVLATKINAEQDLKKTKSAPPHLLFKPGLDRGNVQPGSEGRVIFELLDRVVCVDQSATMPLGQRGTIVGIQQPEVQEEAATIEESFKTTNSTMLETLVILCDPQPDVFEKPSGILQLNSSNSIKSTGPAISTSNMTSSLYELLGIGNGSNGGLNMGALSSFGGVPSKDVPQPVVESKSTSQSINEYKPVPRLVKLFPFQVLKITGCEVQTYKEETSKSKPVQKVATKPMVLLKRQNEPEPKPMVLLKRQNEPAPKPMVLLKRQNEVAPKPMALLKRQNDATPKTTALPKRQNEVAPKPTVGIQKPKVQKDAATTEESFKTSNSAMLEHLVGLRNPPQDVCTKPSGTLKLNSLSYKDLADPNSKKVTRIDMTSSLYELLGIGNGSNGGLNVGALSSSGGVPSKDVSQPVVQSKKSQPSTNEYKPNPLVVNSFPFQVLNITDCEDKAFKEERSELKPEQKVTPNTTVLLKHQNEVTSIPTVVLKPQNEVGSPTTANTDAISKNIPSLFPEQQQPNKTVDTQNVVPPRRPRLAANFPAFN